VSRRLPTAHLERVRWWSKRGERQGKQDSLILLPSFISKICNLLKDRGGNSSLENYSFDPPFLAPASFTFALRIFLSIFPAALLGISSTKTIPPLNLL
jgi:hypothetical protein